MAEEIDLKKYTFRNFGSSVTLTLTLDRVEVTLVRICGRGLPTHQSRWKSEKLFVDVRTDGRTHLSSNLLGHRRGDDLKIEGVSFWTTAKCLILLIGSSKHEVHRLLHTRYQRTQENGHFPFSDILTLMSSCKTRKRMKILLHR